MRKFLIILSAAFLALVSCKNSPKDSTVLYADAENDFISSLTLQDTLQVLSLTDSCMHYLKDGNVEKFVDQILVLDHGILYAPADSYKAQLINRFKHYPVYGYLLSSLAFSTAPYNDVVYTYRFTNFQDGQKEQTMKLTFNPVKVEGVWYLTLKDGNQPSKSYGEANPIDKYTPAPGEPTLNKK